MQPTTQLPPRPRGHRFIGLLPGKRDWTQCLGEIQRECGDVAYFKYLGQPACLISHPDLLADVLIVNAQTYTKSNVLRTLLGDGLVTSEGELWRRQRNLLLPVFSRERLPDYARIMTHHIDRMMSQWRDGEVRDIYQDMTALALNIAAEVFLGTCLGEETATLQHALEIVFDEYIVQANQAFLIPDWLPTPSNLRFRRAAQTILRIVDKIIADRRAEIAQGEPAKRDLLGVLLEAQRRGFPVSDQLVKDEAVTFLLGGHETTANALAWTWHLLGEHPEIEARMAQHLDLQLYGRPVRFEDLPRLPYVEQVVKESMRLFPAAWYCTRKAARDVEIGGYLVPAGTTVVMNMWGLHRDARFYPDPDSFRPERWTEKFADDLPKFAYLPFGAGPRMCIGSIFAKTEAVLAVAAIAQRFQVQAVPNSSVTPVAATTLRPGRGGVRVILRERSLELSAQCRSRILHSLPTHGGGHYAVAYK